MWGRAAQGIRRCGSGLFAPHAATPLPAAAATALRPCCSSPSPPSASSSPTSPPNDVSSAPASSRAIVGAGLTFPADLTVGEGLAFVDPLPAPPRVDPTLLQPRVVVYDGVCHLCHAGVKWIIKADKYKKIKFCCLQSKAAEPYLRLSGLDREDVLRRFLFVEGLYSYHQASTAALKVVSYLPLPYSALSILLVIPAPLRDLVYDYVAKRRYDWFGKEEECIIVQEKELLDRFIDRDELLENKNDFS